MRKRIGDLTLREKDTMCRKYDDCEKCPLNEALGTLYCSTIKKEYFDKEIEVEE